MSPGSVRSVLWHNPYDRSTELCRLTETATGSSLEGVMLVPIEDRPARVDYRVDADEAWNATSARIRIASAMWTREIVLARDAGGWKVDGMPRPSLDDCPDVDLRLTAATNTLPIRRLGLEVGEVAHVRAAWVGFPDLEVLPLDQSYERLSVETYRYRSGAFAAELTVDGTGIVLRYGDELWNALAIG